MSFNSNTLLDAVNRCLASVGELPVSSLDEPNVDVGNALSIIQTLSREIQTNQGKGWWFNTEWNPSFSPAPSTGIVELPNNHLADSVALDPNRYISDGYRIVVRGRRLYDSMSQSFDMTEIAEQSDGRVYLDRMIVELPYDDVPQVARKAITDASRAIFVQDFEADFQKLQALADTAKKSYFGLQNAEALQRKHNFLQDNSTVRDFVVKAGGYNNPY